MFGVAEFAIRLLARFGALAGFIVLAAFVLFSLTTLARAGLRPVAPSTSVSIVMIASLLAMALLAAPAWRSAVQLGSAFASLNRTLPAPDGPLAVADTTLSLEAPSTASPISVRVWFPAAPSPQPRRLILYAPGIGGDRDQNAVTLANLASRGYVVVAFNDISRDPAPAGETSQERNVREGRFEFATREAYAQTLANADRRAGIQAARAREILDRFAAMANDSSTPWGGNVDVAQIGFVGYSFGGATAAETALLDPRIVAVANIDGALFGRAAEAPVQVPYLLILSDMRRLAPLSAQLRRGYDYLLDERELAMARTQSRSPDSTIVEIQLSSHAAFTDDYFSRAHLASWLTLPPSQAHEILQTQLIPFLALYLPTQAGSRSDLTPPERALQFDGAPS